jgi:hypothetical protein
VERFSATRGFFADLRVGGIAQRQRAIASGSILNV